MNKERGRPRGGSDAKVRLIDAAQQLFLERGYDRTTLRSVAELAGVDHSLVKYHFGSKDALFGQSVGMLVTPMAIARRVDFSQEPAALAASILQTFLTIWDRDSFRGPIIKLVTDGSGRGLDVLRDYAKQIITDVLVAGLTGPDVTQRASGVAVIILGLAYTRYILRVEPIASMSGTDLVRVMGPALTVVLTPRRRVSG